MSDNNKLPKQARPQEFELVELLFREYISSHIARPDIEYSFQARFQSFIDQIPSSLHSVSKTGFFTPFFFRSFASLLNTTLAQQLGIKTLHYNFEHADHLRIVAEKQATRRNEQRIKILVLLKMNGKRLLENVQMMLCTL